MKKEAIEKAKFVFIIEKDTVIQIFDLHKIVCM